MILFIPLIVEVTTTSCCQCDNDPEVIKEYSNLRVRVDNLDNSGAEPVISSSGSIVKEAYGMRINVVRALIAQIDAAKPGFITSAYSFSCNWVDGRIIPVDSVVDASIITLHDFDASHPAGSDVTAFFSVRTKAKPNTLVTLKNYL